MKETAPPEIAQAKLFRKLNATLEKWIYEPDCQAIRIVLGTIKAHYLKTGDPAWLFLIGPPGTAKTTAGIAGASNLAGVIQLSDFTEATFISGFTGKEEPGLLEKLGTPQMEGQSITTEGDAIFLAKDFSTVLTMRREKRATILSQLREIHDGQYSRSFGTGVTKIWKGRISIVAAVTPALDRYYSVFSVLGERFLQIRWHRPGSKEAGEWAIRQQGREGQIKEELTDIVTQLFSSSASIPPQLPTDMVSRIASLAEIVALGRTHVLRSSYGSREIEYVPEPEANTRISKGLAAIARGVAALNGRAEVAEQDLQDALRVGLDCIPEARQKILAAAWNGRSAGSVPINRTVRGRELEEMRELGLLSRRVSLNPCNFDGPVLHERIRELLDDARVVPKCSGFSLY